MEESKVIQAQKALSDYLSGKNLRLTEERSAIIDCICGIPGHFDINTLHSRLDENNFHVSKATLYNNMDLFIAAGIIIRHQFAQQIVQYELREMAEKHIHLVCVECGALKEIKKKELDDEEAHLPKYRGFHPQCKIDYVYGLCSKCRRKSDKTIKRK